MNHAFEERFLAARRKYMESQFADLNPMQRTAALTTEGPLTLEMERYFRRGPSEEMRKVRAERVLELNAESPVFEAIKSAVDCGDEAKVEKYAKLLYGQAALLAGLPMDDPAEYAQLVCSLMI